MTETTTDTWRPLADLPPNREMHILVRTAGGDVDGWRWLRYKKGSQPPYVGGRWQIATEYGWRNETFPPQGEWQPNPAIKTAPK